MRAEEEANLGNAAAITYPEFVEKVKRTKTEIAVEKVKSSKPEVQTVRASWNEQKRIKENFKAKYEAEREKLALFAASQHHLNDKLVQALAHIEAIWSLRTPNYARVSTIKRNLRLYQLSSLEIHQIVCRLHNHELYVNIAPP
ncbi:hypothetical protein O9992_09610 [Vibrio lentus]|nr:hypothetical protein [Vibrio lentus]